MLTCIRLSERVSNNWEGNGAVCPLPQMSSLHMPHVSFPCLNSWGEHRSDLKTGNHCSATPLRETQANVCVCIYMCMHSYMHTYTDTYTSLKDSLHDDFRVFWDNSKSDRVRKWMCLTERRITLSYLAWLPSSFLKKFAIVRRKIQPEEEIQWGLLTLSLLPVLRYPHGLGQYVERFGTFASLSSWVFLQLGVELQGHTHMEELDLQIFQ